MELRTWYIFHIIIDYQPHISHVILLIKKIMLNDSIRKFKCMHINNQHIEIYLKPKFTVEYCCSNQNACSHIQFLCIYFESIFNSHSEWVNLLLTSRLKPREKKTQFNVLQFIYLNCDYCAVQFDFLNVFHVIFLFIFIWHLLFRSNSFIYFYSWINSI